MRVLGLSFGSIDGSCDIACKEALMGAQEAGAEVHFIHMQKVLIRPCTGCYQCKEEKTSYRCPLEDDYGWLREQIGKADALMIVSPVHCKGASGLFRVFAERVSMDYELYGKKYVSYIGMAGTDWDACVEHDQAMQAATAGWKVVANIRCRWSKLILMDDNKLARAHQIGVKLATADRKPTKHEKDTAAILEDRQGACPVCGNNLFLIQDDGTSVACSVCGRKGIFTKKGIRMEFVPTENSDVPVHITKEGFERHKKETDLHYGKFSEMMKIEEYQSRLDSYCEYLEEESPSNS